MNDLENNNQFVVLSGYMTDGNATWHRVGGYEACRRKANQLIAEDNTRPVFIGMIVESWKGR